MKKLLSLVLAMLLLTCLAGSSFAMVEGDINGSVPEVGLEQALERAWEVIRADEGKGLEELSDENNANYYHYNPYGHTTPQDPQLSVQKEDSWDAVVQKLFEKYGLEPDEENLALTYYNTVTGEHHAYNDDKYFVTASLFKVPLCMLIAEKVSAGEITMDETIAGEPFSYQEYRALVHSDNNAALRLEEYLGGYVEFRNQEVKLTEENPRDDIGDNMYYESYNTAHQMENVLRKLQADPDKYPGVIENMLIDTPYEYFKMWDRRYPTAQKWGYVPHTDLEGAHDYVNNFGIIYTDQPILLVVMTDNLAGGYDIIGEYATLMIDYTNFRTEEYQENVALAEEEARETLKSKSLSDYAPNPVPVPKQAESSVEDQQREIEAKENKMSVLSTAMLVVVITAALFALVVIYRRNKGGRISTGWAVLAIIVAAAALVLCLLAKNTGTLSAETEGDPQDAVRGFMDNLKAGEYEQAYSYLSNYSTLGLEEPMETEEGQLIMDALKNSWDYTLKGDAEVDKLQAKQKVMIRYLNLEQLEKLVSDGVEEALDSIVQSRSLSEVYDENNRYLTSVTDEAYKNALIKALESADSCYRTKELELELEYVDNGWKVKASDELIACLLGGES